MKSSLEKVQSNFIQVQENSTAAIDRLEKQNEDKLSQSTTSHQCDLDRQKVIILVSLFIAAYLFTYQISFCFEGKKLKKTEYI